MRLIAGIMGLWRKITAVSCKHCYHSRVVTEEVPGCVWHSKEVRRTIWICCLCGNVQQAYNSRGEPLLDVIEH